MMYPTDNIKFDFIRMYLGLFVLTFITIMEMYFFKDYYRYVILTGIPLTLILGRLLR